MEHPYLYRPVRKLFCDVLNYHPVSGGWERPIVMNRTEFNRYVMEQGECWWEWPLFDSEIPTSIETMIEEIEFVSGKITPSILTSQCKRWVFPIMKIAKANTKTGKQTVVPQFHLPLGNQYDSRITKQKSLYAFQLIQSGQGVSDAIQKASTNWNALKRHTPYEPVRLKTYERVKRVIQLYEGGLKLSESLSSVGMSSRTFWIRTGGIRRVLSHNNNPEWIISKSDKEKDGETNESSIEDTYHKTRITNTHSI